MSEQISDEGRGVEGQIFIKYESAIKSERFR